ncbi:MAG: hypothetical protein FWD16_06825 [Clostridia bacterium]|nr:hypothetical protein [Clostridia bacterium]
MKKKLIVAVVTIMLLTSMAVSVNAFTVTGTVSLPKNSGWVALGTGTREVNTANGTVYSIPSGSYIIYKIDYGTTTVAGPSLPIGIKNWGGMPYKSGYISDTVKAFARNDKNMASAVNASINLKG